MECSSREVTASSPSPRASTTSCPRCRPSAPPSSETPGSAANSPRSAAASGQSGRPTGWGQGGRGPGSCPGAPWGASCPQGGLVRTRAPSSSRLQSNVKWHFDFHAIARNWKLRTYQVRRLRNLFNLATSTNTVDKKSGKIQASEVNHSSVVRLEKY